MPRRPRPIVPEVPLHITQRGIDRGPTFLADDDFAFYRHALRISSVEARCAVHAYALMTNHVHLLVTPADAMGPPTLMSAIGRRYVRYFNDRYRRTGSLWEGRYRCALVDTASYVLTCSRYIELNPVRAGLVDDPAAYEWSSFCYNAHGESDPVLSPHALYLALGEDDATRRAAYRALFGTAISPAVTASIRAAPVGRPPLHTTPYRALQHALARDDMPRNEHG